MKGETGRVMREGRKGLSRMVIEARGIDLIENVWDGRLYRE